MRRNLRFDWSDRPSLSSPQKTHPAPILWMFGTGAVCRRALAGSRDHTRHQHIGDFLPGC